MSIRTVYRDLRGLQAAGFPIYFDSDRHTYRFAGHFQVQRLHLESEELGILVDALNFTRRTGPLRFRRSVGALIDKVLAGQLPQDHRTDPLVVRESADQHVRLRFLPAVAALARGILAAHPAG